MKKLFLFLIIPFFLFSQENGFSLLKINPDARRSGMGDAGSILSQDASGVFLNPAILSITDGLSLFAGYNDWIFDFKQTSIAAQVIQGKHNLALSLNMLQMPDIEIRGLRPVDEPLGKTEASNLALGVSYARAFTNDLNFGVTLKYLFERYYFSNAPGWAIDFGFIKKNLFQRFDAGFSVLNLGKMSKLDDQATQLPFIVRAGLHYPLMFLEQNISIISDLEWIRDEKMYFHGGFEYTLFEYLLLRSGIRNGNDKLLFSFGLGIKYNSIRADYSYSSLEYNLADVNRFSVIINF